MSKDAYLTTPLPIPAATTKFAVLGFWLLVCVLILAGLRKIVMYDTMDPDAFWHFRVGHRLMIEGPHPIVDDISFASIREAWTPYSWLAEIGMAKLWDSGGFRATVIVECLMTTGIILFIAAASKIGAQSSAPGKNDKTPTPTLPGSTELAEVRSTRGGSETPLLAAALATGAGGFLTLPYLSFRPATAAVLALAMTAYILFRDRERGERTYAIWLLVPTCLLLINIHLFAMLIPAWVGALAAGAAVEWWRTQSPADTTEAVRRFRRLAILLVLCALACLATPVLGGLIHTSLHYGRKDEMVASGIIAEIRPFYSGDALAHAALVIVLIMGIAVICNWQRLRPGEWFWLAMSTVLLFKFGRFSPLFAPVAAPIFATTMPRFSARVLGKPFVCAVAGLVTIIGLIQVARSFPGPSTDLNTWLNRNPTGGYPTEAVQYVLAHPAPPGRELRVINEFNWGGYLAWMFRDTSTKIFVDGRTQLYPTELWRATYLGPGDDIDRIANYLATLDADVAILPKEKSRFAKSLTQLGWSELGDEGDKWAVIMVPPRGGSATRRATTGAEK